MIHCLLFLLWLKRFVKSNSSFLIVKKRGITFHLLLVAPWNSKFARYLLQKLLVAKKHPLLVAEAARRKELHVTRCRSCTLPKFTCYSLENLLAARCKKSLVTEVARCKKSFLARCKVRSFFHLDGKIYMNLNLSILLYK